MPGCQAVAQAEAQPEAGSIGGKMAAILYYRIQIQNTEYTSIPFPFAAYLFQVFSKNNCS